MLAPTERSSFESYQMNLLRVPPEVLPQVLPGKGSPGCHPRCFPRCYLRYRYYPRCYPEMALPGATLGIFPGATWGVNPEVTRNAPPGVNRDVFSRALPEVALRMASRKTSLGFSLVFSYWWQAILRIRKLAIFWGKKSAKSYNSTSVIRSQNYRLSLHPLISCVHIFDDHTCFKIF